MDANSYVEIKPNRNIPSFRSGDTVRVHVKVVEGERERIQVFEGVVIRKKRGGINSNFTVRRVSHGIGVERVFPYHSPLIAKVEVTKVGRVRRARLYYLRDRVGKAARIRVGSRERFEDLAAELAAGAQPLEEEETEPTEALEEGAEAEVSDEEATPETDAEEAAVEEAPAAEDEPAPEAAAEEAQAADEPEKAAEESGDDSGEAAEEAPAADEPEKAAEESGDDSDEATEEAK